MYICEIVKILSILSDITDVQFCEVDNPVTFFFMPPSLLLKITKSKTRVTDYFSFAQKKSEYINLLSGRKLNITLQIRRGK